MHFRRAEETELLQFRRDLKGGAMFRQLAKPRAGVAKFPSDGEEIFVTKSR